MPRRALPSIPARRRHARRYQQFLVGEENEEGKRKLRDSLGKVVKARNKLMHGEEVGSFQELREELYAPLRWLLLLGFVSEEDGGRPGQFDNGRRPPGVDGSGALQREASLHEATRELMAAAWK